MFVSDAQGRRPSIYTFLGGAPNWWPRSKVDHNLRAVSGEGIEASEFDRGSVMLYRFPALFYRTPDSDCVPSGDGQSLSDVDVAGLRALYPAAGEAAAEVVGGKRKVLAGLRPAGAVGGFESSAPAVSRVLEASAACLERQLSGM